MHMNARPPISRGLRLIVTEDGSYEYQVVWDGKTVAYAATAREAEERYDEARRIALHGVRAA